MNLLLRYMTPEPLTVSPADTLEEAHRRMHRSGVRHLPVVEDGRLVGVVSERDLLLVATLGDVDPADEPVEEAMTDAPFTVSPEEPAGVVARIMAERRYGCAVVLRDQRVIGIFTTVDALRCLADHLEAPAAAPGGGATPDVA